LTALLAQVLADVERLMLRLVCMPLKVSRGLLEESTEKFP
jgi:hypothetical protein